MLLATVCLPKCGKLLALKQYCQRIYKTICMTLNKTTTPSIFTLSLWIWVTRNNNTLERLDVLLAVVIKSASSVDDVLICWHVFHIFYLLHLNPLSHLIVEFCAIQTCEPLPWHMLYIPVVYWAWNLMQDYFYERVLNFHKPQLPFTEFKLLASVIKSNLDIIIQHDVPYET